MHQLVQNASTKYESWGSTSRFNLGTRHRECWFLARVLLTCLSTQKGNCLWKALGVSIQERIIMPSGF